jgi:FAD:protein FMN transferase
MKGASAARQQRPAARRAPIAAPLFAVFLASCASTGVARELQGEGLGSTWKVTLADRGSLDPQSLQHGIQQQIDTVTHQLSRWDSTSTLSTLNTAPDDAWHTLPSELFSALSYALALAADTRGAYDPTVAPLVDVWGFGTHGRRYSPPSADAIRSAQTRVGWSKITLDTAQKRVHRPAGVQIDLSSMTHGLAADRVAAYLRSNGVTRYLVDVGSELRAQGNAPEGHPWQVAIERPPSEYSPDLASADAAPSVSSAGAAASTAHAAASTSEGAPNSSAMPMHVVALRDAGIATSGNYRYFFDYNGHRYSHRIDPRTGAPISNSLASVTVIAPECMHADALATALTVLGPDDGLEYAQRHSIAALFILRTEQGLEERMTPEFKAYID